MNSTKLVYNPTNCPYYMGALQIPSFGYRVVTDEQAQILKDTEMLLEGDKKFPDLWVQCSGNGDKLE